MKLLFIKVVLISTSLGLAGKPSSSTSPPSISSSSSVPPPAEPSLLPSLQPLPLASEKPVPLPSPPPLPTPLEAETEDQRTINETIKKYGFPRDYTILGLPGPQLKVDGDKLEIGNRFRPRGQGSYRLKVRTITEYFSYNGRYEVSQLKKVGDQEIPIIKGQFGEHFARKSGGFYVRTIGYTLDENGYQQFLVDLTTAQTTLKEIEQSVGFGGSIVGSAPGGPSVVKETITSTALGSLIGGNALG